MGTFLPLAFAPVERVAWSEEMPTYLGLDARKSRYTSVSAAATGAARKVSPVAVEWTSALVGGITSSSALISVSTTAGVALNWTGSQLRSSKRLPEAGLLFAVSVALA
jgi:hypothetical protein